MAKKTKELEREGMNFVTKLLFTTIFFMMGGAIIGAGLNGQEATAPIVITIGMLMVAIGLAPYYVPLLYKNLVPQEQANVQEAY